MKKLIYITSIIFIIASNILSSEVVITPLKTGNLKYNSAPYLSLDGNLIIFSSETAPNNENPISNDLWLSQKTSNLWSEPQDITNCPLFDGNQFNSKFYEGSFTMTADGRTIIFASCGRADSYGDCDIYWSRLKENGWTVPAPMGRNINSTNWDGMPTISPDGKTLYFVSNRKGSKSNSMDIWYSQYDSDLEEWSQAQNLSNINTKYDDICPFIAPDGLTLLFSSNGYEETFGGSDIYFIRFDKKANKWGKAENIGKPINSELNERYISFDGTGCNAVISRRGIEPTATSEDFFICKMSEFFNPIQSFSINLFSNSTNQPIFANIVAKTNKKTLLNFSGSTSKVLITEKDFDFADYIDVEISVKNATHEKSTKVIRLFNPSKMDSIAKLNYISKMNFDLNFVLNENGKNIEITTDKPQINTNLIVSDILNSNTSIKEISIKEKNIVRSIPILNYIFFDENSSQIPNRYITKSTINGKKFTFEDINTNEQNQFYYQILNIIGLRMSQIPTAKLNIIGFNSLKSKESKNTKLAKERADAVSNYLQKEWNVAPERLNISYKIQTAIKGVKAKENSDDYQRVEFSSDDNLIFDNIIFQENNYESQPSDLNLTYNTKFLNSSGNWVFSIKVFDVNKENISGQNNVNTSKSINISRDIVSLPIKNREYLSKISQSHIDTLQEKELTFFEKAKQTLKSAGDELSKTASNFEKSIEKDDYDKIRLQKESDRLKKLLVFQITAKDTLSNLKSVSRVELPLKLKLLTADKKNQKQSFQYFIFQPDIAKPLSDIQKSSITELNKMSNQSFPIQVIAYYDEINTQTSKPQTESYLEQFSSSIGAKSKLVLSNKYLDFNFQSNYPEYRFYNKLIQIKYESEIIK